MADYAGANPPHALAGSHNPERSYHDVPYRRENHGATVGPASFETHRFAMLLRMRE